MKEKMAGMMQGISRLNTDGRAAADLANVFTGTPARKKTSVIMIHATG
jgi:hypothetical protein